MLMRPILYVVSAIALAICLPLTALSAPLYHVTDLGALTGGDDQSEAFGISSNSAIAGDSDAATGERAVLWAANGALQNLADLPGGTDRSRAADVNSSGQVVGFSFGSAGLRAFLWTVGSGMQDLGTLPGGSTSVANGINASGQIVGRSSVLVGAVLRDHAMLYASGSMQDLGDLPGGDDKSQAWAINDNGQVVGQASGTTGTRAFLWTAGGGMQDLGDLPGGSDRSLAYDINTSGQIVGESDTTSDSHSFLWTSSQGLLDLGVLPNDTFSRALAINAGGEIVGVSGGDNLFHAYIWTSDLGMQSLGTLTDLSGLGWQLRSANGINDAGQIVGSGYNPDGAFHAFLLTPVPEPSTAALAACGVALMTVVAMRRRRLVQPRSGETC